MMRENAGIVLVRRSRLVSARNNRTALAAGGVTFIGSLAAKIELLVGLLQRLLLDLAVHGAQLLANSGNPGEWFPLIVRFRPEQMAWWRRAGT
jgi:hypothetical protein